MYVGSPAIEGYPFILHSLVAIDEAEGPKLLELQVSGAEFVACIWEQSLFVR